MEEICDNCKDLKLYCAMNNCNVKSGYKVSFLSWVYRYFLSFFKRKNKSIVPFQAENFGKIYTLSRKHYRLKTFLNYLEMRRNFVEITEPVVEITEPVVEITEPVVEITEPVVEITEPVVEITDPVVIEAVKKRWFFFNVCS